MRRLLALLVVLLAPSPAFAEAAAKVRLLVGGVVDGRVEAGLAIDLPEGWKTYWRTPGDAGIPPTLEAGRSTGLEAISVSYPAPVRFDEAGLTAIGYTRSVVLPLEARLTDPSKPGRLALDVMIGLCHDICIPFETSVEAAIAPTGTGEAEARAAIAAARARVPRAVTAGAPPFVVAMRREIGPVGPRLVAEVKPAADHPLADVFVEGPGPDWALPQPERIGARGVDDLWAFDFDGAPKDADLSAVDLRFTLTTADGAVEQIVRVDVRPPAP